MKNEVRHFFLKETPTIREDRAFHCISIGELRDDEGKEAVRQCRQTIEIHGEKMCFTLKYRMIGLNYCGSKP